MLGFFAAVHDVVVDDIRVDAQVVDVDVERVEEERFDIVALDLEALGHIRLEVGALEPLAEMRIVPTRLVDDRRGQALVGVIVVRFAPFLVQLRSLRFR